MLYDDSVLLWYISHPTVHHQRQEENMRGMNGYIGEGVNNGPVDWAWHVTNHVCIEQGGKDVRSEMKTSRIQHS